MSTPAAATPLIALMSTLRRETGFLAIFVVITSPVFTLYKSSSINPADW